MILTTTQFIHGRNVVEYKGLVFGEVISGVNVGRDIAASFRGTFGGRASSYESELASARAKALKELEARAKEVGILSAKAYGLTTFLPASNQPRKPVPSSTTS